MQTYKLMVITLRGLVFFYSGGDYLIQHQDYSMEETLNPHIIMWCNNVHTNHTHARTIKEEPLFQ